MARPRNHTPYTDEELYQGTDLPQELREHLVKAISAQAQIVSLQEAMDAALDERRFAVLSLVEADVSKYRIALALGVSQATAINIQKSAEQVRARAFEDA